MIRVTRTLELDLRTWTEHYPSGAVLYSNDSNGRVPIASEYCGAIEDFKCFIDRNAAELDRYQTELIVLFNPLDAAVSNVITVIDEIARYFDTVTERM